MQYIKAPRRVARHLGLEYDRQLFADGNYLLWDRDFLRLGPSESFGALIPACGCRVLTAAEVREEQQGGTPHELPAATDPRFAEAGAQQGAQQGAQGSQGAQLPLLHSKEEGGGPVGSEEEGGER